jgi:hypothetical protein
MLCKALSPFAPITEKAAQFSPMLQREIFLLKADLPTEALKARGVEATAGIEPAYPVLQTGA